MTCEICNTKDITFSWTDTHGVAQCIFCGVPYRIYHYDGDGKRIDKGPESIVAENYKPILKEYWETFKRIIPSGCSFPGGYELATEEDEESFYRWLAEKMENQDNG